MPAKSKAQQKAAGAALAAKRGETKRSSLKGASKSMEKSMTEKELEDFASTKRKGLPAKKSELRRLSTAIPIRWNDDGMTISKRRCERDEG